MSKKRNKQHKNKEGSGDDQQPARHKNVNWPSVYPVDIEPNSEDEHKCAAECTHRNSQRRIGIALNIITGCGTVAALLGLLYLWGTLKATERSAGAADSAATTAKEALVRSQRPWVGPEKESGISFTVENMVTMSIISVSLKNYGPSPALYLGETFQPTNLDKSLAPIEEMSNSSCKMAEIAVISSDNLPGQSFGFYMLPNADETFYSKRAWSPEKPFNAIVGCVAYVDQFHSTSIHSPIHHTSFCFQSYSPIAPKTPIPRMFGCNFAQTID